MADRLDPTLGDPRAYDFINPVLLRFRDLDMLGHVNNVALAGWLEDGRVALELPIQPCTPSYSGPVIVLLEARIRYLEEIHLPDHVEVGTRIQKLGQTSVVIGQGVFANGKCAAMAEFVEVLIDPGTRRPTPWPADFRAHLERYLRKG
ncbi:MAG: acyl-CoA thioesterase [Gemmatimonadetes bacterium]|nr:acyl-CoA thioesterase [Gemmatimonadota bacterium]